MEYRTLGRSGTVVSTLALGTMTFGSETDENGSHDQLDLFLEAGGTLVDTADVYTAGASEEIIGRWLDDRPSEVTDRVVLATKARFPMGADRNDVGLSRRHLGRALDDSLRRLQVDCIDLYQVHAWDPLTPVEETLGFFDDAVRAGKVRYAGLSNYAGWQVQKAVDVADHRRLPRPVTLQPQYNLLVREIEWEIVPACLENGLGLLPWSPLGGGWLTGKYTRDQRPTGATRLGEDPERGVEAYGKRSASERTWAVVDAVQTAAAAHGVSMAAAALAWLHDRPAVCSVILGARTSEQLTANLAAAGLHLDQAATAALDAASDPAPADYPYGPAGVEQRDPHPLTGHRPGGRGRGAIRPRRPPAGSLGHCRSRGVSTPCLPVSPTRQRSPEPLRESCVARHRHQEADHRGARQLRHRHRNPRGPGRDALAPHLRPDRAPQGAQARPPLASWPAPARRPASPAAELPGQDRHQPLPRVDREARPAPLTTHSEERLAPASGPR